MAKTEQTFTAKDIEERYKSLKDKKAFLYKCSEKFGGKVTSYASNWFSRFFAVPDPKKAEVIEMLDQQLEKESSQ